MFDKLLYKLLTCMFYITFHMDTYHVIINDLLLVHKISLGVICGPSDVCADVNAQCIQGVCRCTGDFVVIGNQCGKFDCLHMTRTHARTHAPTHARTHARKLDDRTSEKNTNTRISAHTHAGTRTQASMHVRAHTRARAFCIS